MKKIEDIYPLTIISTKFGDIVIIEGLACSACISSLQEDEEVGYEPRRFMNDKWSHVNYGLGTSIHSAFDDFKFRYKK